MSRLTARDLAYIATFAAIIAAMGLVPAFSPFGIAVPITLQSLGVMLAGAVLGRWRGAAAVVLMLVLAFVGLPILASGAGGPSAFVGPSAGFLIGWPIAAWVVGWLSEVGGTPYRFWWGVVANVLGGIVVLYPFGIIGMALLAHLSVPTAAAMNLAYVPGDLAKAVVAAVVARGVHAGYPGLLRARRRHGDRERVSA